MKPTCTKCGSDNLDQGVNGKILCHDCKSYFYLVATWHSPTISSLTNIES